MVKQERNCFCLILSIYRHYCDVEYEIIFTVFRKNLNLATYLLRDLLGGLRDDLEADSRATGPASEQTACWKSSSCAGGNFGWQNCSYRGRCGCRFVIVTLFIRNLGLFCNNYCSCCFYYITVLAKEVLSFDRSFVHCFFVDIRRCPLQDRKMCLYFKFTDLIMKYHSDDKQSTYLSNKHTI